MIVKATEDAINLHQYRSDIHGCRQDFEPSVMESVSVIDSVTSCRSGRGGVAAPQKQGVQGQSPGGVKVVETPEEKFEILEL